MMDILVAQELNNMNNKFDFNDILIVPAVTSDINSRKDINPFYHGYLPLITAPMDTVISLKNKDVFSNNKVNICLPRGEELNYAFNSYSLIEITKMYEKDLLRPTAKYLIDIANGHMDGLVKMVEKIKTKYPKITLMVGNVANPKTFVVLATAGADYIRVGIGNGGGCSTTLHTGVGYPMASLINECYKEKIKNKLTAKIVGDGGMQTYSDIIKALGLGADYVMVGSIFNKAIESCGDNFLWGKIKVNQDFAKIAYTFNIPVYKKFRGMSTKEVQKKWGKEKLTTSEGVIRLRKVEYSISKWIENFEDYLRSAMSYTNSKKLTEFIGKAKFIEITDNAYIRFKK
jgi:IMP dehydrogenase/GMP reductase